MPSPKQSSLYAKSSLNAICSAMVARFPSLGREMLPSLVACKRYRTPEDAHYRRCVDMALRAAELYRPALARKLYALPYRMWAEHYFLVHASTAAIQSVPLRVHQRRHAAASLAAVRGRGVIFACSNFGCLQYALLSLEGVIDELLVLVNDVTDPVRDVCAKVEEISGIRIVLAAADASSALIIVRHLRRGGAMMTLLDSYHGDDARFFVPFMGRPAVASSGVYTLAGHCAAVIFPVAMVRNGRGYVTHIGAPVDARDSPPHVACQEINAFFEARIRAHPEQWLAWPNLLHRWRLAGSMG